MDEYNDDELIIDDEDLEEGDEQSKPESEIDYKAEALKYKSIAKRWKKKATSTPAPQPQASTRIEAPAPTGLNEEYIKLRLDGRSEEEVEFIMANGGRKALENPWVSAAINARREQAEAEAEASKLPDTSGMTDVERKFTPEQLNEMSVEELKKILPKA